jgi:UDP-N-acetylmuramoylalanine--D-glutamate ligase
MGHTLVLGAGRSALGAAKLLIKQGHELVVSDIEEKFPEQLDAIRQTGARVVIGPQTSDLLAGVDRVIVSPGLSPRIPILIASRERGIPVQSEIDIALKAFTGEVFGVTGTNGKSTTTLLLAHFLNALGTRVEASGNIGVPPSLLIAENKVPEALVLELSSYQLDFSESIPNCCSLFMSFAPDHMERHGTMEQYFAAKWKLILATASDGLCIMPRKIVEAAKAYRVAVPKARIVQVLEDGEELLPFGQSVALHLSGTRVSCELWPGELSLPSSMEIHNRLNVAAAIAATRSPGPQSLVPMVAFSIRKDRQHPRGSGL